MNKIFRSHQKFSTILGIIRYVNACQASLEIGESALVHIPKAFNNVEISNMTDSTMAITTNNYIYIFKQLEEELDF
jgi:hypothetical protein